MNSDLQDPQSAASSLATGSRCTARVHQFETCPVVGMFSSEVLSPRTPAMCLNPCSVSLSSPRVSSWLHANAYKTLVSLSPAGVDLLQAGLRLCREALAGTQVVTPRIPVISNVDAEPHSDPEVIKDILARQVRHFTILVRCMSLHLKCLHDRCMGRQLNALAALCGNPNELKFCRVWRSFDGQP